METIGVLPFLPDGQQIAFAAGGSESEPSATENLLPEFKAAK